jgi:hypothetical protein
LAKLIDRVRMTHGEYRANLTGLNIFFGAVLGFVLAGTEALDPLPFALLLTMAAGAVISILYITSSERRVMYSIMTLFVIAFMDRWADPLLPMGFDLPAKLQPTLAVWALLTMFVEFMPRERNSGQPAEEEE